ncbi:LysR family transcriptional regulator [Winogradskyella arenosi]|uniref:LysR family transcriptional regulator n=1 Tax=Winogradskyella arenosi TaxID=533325 RepID=A0A368ZF67_9FLAO|nr:LysR family transcriptional regulator [Winogradskyella arenosi]RCW92166.1 LysR family transcriptional regulator [Winogradskyella arenosi]
MTTQQIRYFLELANVLHFWNTAEKLSISQSTLSRQIQALEEEFDLKLLERDKRNVKLTAAGQFLKEHWTTTLNELDRLHLQAKKIDVGTSGVISLAYPGSISSGFLPQLMRVLTQEMPELKIELTEPTDLNHEKLILDYHIDIAISRDEILNPTIQSKKLYAEPICLVVPKGHWVNATNFTDLKMVENENFIISALHNTTYFSSLLREVFKQHNVEPKTTIESDFGSVILNLVAQSLGVSILPYAFKSANNKAIRFIELPHTVDLYINWRRHDPNSIIKRIVSCSEALGKEYIS